jgi:hypothetical protein
MLCMIVFFVKKGGPMLGNMGPKEKWIWENIHSLYTNINNALQQENYKFYDFFKNIFVLMGEAGTRLFGKKVSIAAKYICCASGD